MRLCVGATRGCVVPSNKCVLGNLIEYKLRLNAIDTAGGVPDRHQPDQGRCRCSLRRSCTRQAGAPGQTLRIASRADQNSILQPKAPSCRTVTMPRVGCSALPLSTRRKRRSTHQQRSHMSARCRRTPNGRTSEICQGVTCCPRSCPMSVLGWGKV